MKRQLVLIGAATGYACGVIYLLWSGTPWAKWAVSALAFVPGAIALFTASGLFGKLGPSLWASIRQWLVGLGPVKSMVFLALFWLNLLAIGYLKAQQESWAMFMLGALALAPGILVAAARWRTLER